MESNPRFERSLARFRKICVLLADSNKAATLKLAISCNVTSLELGRAVLKSLAQLPPLKEFSIDLGPYLNNKQLRLLDPPEFLAFGEEVALEVCRLTRPAPFLPFNRLPAELQDMIFSHLASSELPTTINLSPDEYYDESRRCCMKCTFAYVQVDAGCFCRAKRSKWSSTCICAARNSLYGINRSIREQMLRTVYSKNRFFVGGPIEKGFFSTPLSRAFYVRDLTMDLPVDEITLLDGHLKGILELVARTFRLELLDLKIRPWATDPDPWAEFERNMDNVMKYLVSELRHLAGVRSFTILQSCRGRPLPTNDAGNLFGPESILAYY